MKVCLKISKSGLEKFKSGDYNQKDSLAVLDNLPFYFYNLGYEIDKPLVLNMHKLSNIMKEPKGRFDGVNQHGITMDIIEKIPEAINNPLNVIKNPNFRNRFVIVTDLTDQYGDIILVPVEINNTAEVTGINKINSIYGKETYDTPTTDMLASYMEQNKENIVYDIDNERSSSSNYRLQSPSKTKTTSNINNSVTYNDQNVNEITSTNNHNYMQNEGKRYTEKQFNDITKTISQISNKAIYNNGATINTLRTVSNNVENINLIKQSENYYINALDSDGSVAYQQKIKNRPYTGKQIKEIVNNAIQNADTSFSVENANTDIAQTSQNKNTDNLQLQETSYSLQDIEKITEPFISQEEYTKNEMAKVWNNEIAENEYDVFYDENGNIKNYIAIEEDGDNLVVSLYDNKDNIIRSETISNVDEKYTSNDITSAIKKVTKLYDENELIKGQVDIKGNEVRGMKKNKKRSIQLTSDDINSPGKTSKTDSLSTSIINSIPQNENIIKSIENFEKAKKTVNRKDVLNIANLLNIKIKKGAHKIVDVRMQRKSGHNLEPKIVDITKLFENVTNNNVKKFRKQAMEKALELYRNEIVDIKDTESKAEINKSGIKETYSSGLTKEKIQSSDNIKEIIEEGIYGYTTQDDSDINQILYHHYFSPVSYEQTNGLIRVVIKEFPLDKTSNDKFYYHQIEYISGDIIKEGSALSYPTKNSDNKTVELKPSIVTNSIPQKTKTVKSENTVINKFTQNTENNTIQYDNQGRKLSKEQQNYFENSKVRNESGNLLAVYHGSDNKFNSFNSDVNWFTSSKEYSKYYGRKQNKLQKLLDVEPNKSKYTYQVYLNIKNPKILSNIDGYLQEYNIAKEQFGSYVKEFLKESNIPYTDFKKIVDTYNIGKSKYEQADRIYEITNSKEFKDYLISKGYDGIIANEKENTSYAAFYPEQIKKVSNSNPTSDSDIRYLKKSKQIDSAVNQITEQKAIEKELHNRIQNAILNKNSKKNTFLGVISNKTVNKIKSLLAIDTSNRKHMLPDYNIRHIIKQHGNTEIERTRGQIAVTSKDIEKIPDIINNYDKIEKGSVNTNSITNNHAESIRYVKKYNDNITYVVEVIPQTGNTLEIKTMWKKPVRVTNSKNTPSSTSKTKSNLDSSTLKQNPIGLSYDNNNILPYTSETKSNSGSNTSIAENPENVKNEDVQFAKRTAKSQDENIDKTQRNAERQGAYIEQEIQKIEKTGNWDNSIPITKMTDIRKTIEDYLGLGIKKGHFRQDAYAIYKSNRDVIRTKEYKDIDSILHETGHALDIGNRLKVDKESIANELLTAIDKLGGYEQETRSIRLEEGFAEVIREYTIIPEQARIEYPQTVAILEKLRQKDKGFNNFISKVQEQTYNYIHQNPRNRTVSNQSIGEQTDKTPWTKEWVKQEVMRNVWDKDYALKSAVSTLQKAGGKTSNQLNASDNAYYLTRLASGIGDKVSSMLADGYIDTDGNKLMPGLNQIGEILGNDSERFNDLRAYLLARRDTDYKSKSLKTGVRTSDSMSVIEQFKNDTQIQEASKVIYDTLDGVMQYVVDNGLITQETADKLKESNAFYVPMQRVIENRGNQVGRRGAVADVIKKRTGSELDVKDILENIVANSSNMIQQVENNNILRALYKQGEESGITGAIYDVIDTPMVKVGTANLETWKSELEHQGMNTSNLDLEKTIDLFAPNNKVDRQNLITSFVDENGKRVYLQFNDELIFNSIMNMDKKFMSQVLNITSKLNMPLRYGATMANIGFAIPNMISDTAQASIYSTAGFIPIVDNALGVLDVLAANNKTVGDFLNKVAPEYAKRINTLYAIYNQTGSTSSTRLSQYRKSTQSVMKDIYGTKKSETLGIKESFKPLKRLLDLMTCIPELSEQSTRFEVFKKNYEYYNEKGYSEMDTRIMAALEARDATQDFGRTGNATKEINQLVPFSAARVGSAYTFAEKVKANPKQIGMRIAVLIALGMAIKGLSYDDKEIEELNQRKKDDNFVFKIGDKVITIKKPQGILRSMLNLGEYIQDLATGHIEEGKEGERLNDWLHNAIWDNMPADSIEGFFSSMPGGSLLENAINKDLYYNTEIVKSYDLDLPNSEQYYDYNSQLAIFLGKVFNRSPAKIDNLISGFFGGLGTQVTNIMDTAFGKFGITAQKPEMGAESNAVGKRFVVNVNTNSASIDEIYNKKTELTKKKNGGDITEKETSELESITEVISNISKVNKQIKEIKKDLSMSGKKKADEIKLLQQQKTDIARQALGKDLLYDTNASKIQSITFYPSSSTLKKNGRSLELTSSQKEEYEQIASEYYNKNKSLYNKDKLDTLKSKAKDYAKNQLMQKYKNNLVKTK